MARLVALACVCALFLSGCGDDSAAEPPPSPSPTASSTAPAPPAMPDAAKAPGKAGAIAFVRHYVALLNHAQSTGEVSALESISSQNCKSCTNIENGLQKIYRSGGWIKGGRWRMKVNGALKNESRSWLISTLVQYGPQKVKPAASSSTESRKGGAGVMSITVEWKRSQWEVSSWTLGG